MPELGSAQFLKAITKDERPKMRPKSREGENFERLWYIAASCWHTNPSKRPSANEISSLKQGTSVQLLSMRSILKSVEGFLRSNLVLEKAPGDRPVLLTHEGSRLRDLDLKASSASSEYPTASTSTEHHSHRAIGAQSGRETEGPPKSNLVLAEKALNNDPVPSSLDGSTLLELDISTSSTPRELPAASQFAKYHSHVTGTQSLYTWGCAYEL